MRGEVEARLTGVPRQERPRGAEAKRENVPELTKGISTQILEIRPIVSTTITTIIIQQQQQTDALRYFMEKLENSRKKISQ